MGRITLEDVISAGIEHAGGRNAKAAAWMYSESFVPEDDVVLRARERASDLGCPAVLPGTGALLRVLAASTRARAVVEVGTGAGVAALWLLRGMPDDGQLTTIDREAEHQRAAREAFAEDRVDPRRTRVIPGRPHEVLPRLTDGHYDLVLVGAEPYAYPEHVEEAIRLLRPGGLLAVDNALYRDRVADPTRRDELTATVREVGRAIRADDRVVPAMVPSGSGLLLAVRR